MRSCTIFATLKAKQHVCANANNGLSITAFVAGVGRTNNVSVSRRGNRNSLVKAKPIRCVSSYEREANEQGFTCIAGVDEVGRGCLFGPVFAAAVVLDPSRPVTGLRDSKVIDQVQRERLAAQIQSRCTAWALGIADVFEIDQINIYQASRLAMRRAVKALSVEPDYLLIDAVTIDLPVQQQSLIKGDARCRAIAAASIVAKVQRDACLREWHKVFPAYNLASNKGYLTSDHLDALRKYGPTLLHRFSFEPVRAACPEKHWDGYVKSAQSRLFSSAAAGACE